ncbi:hypothetical protein [Vibrio agarivorans]|uniref:hypothetical protein n=1 Tax=Vibrio agarivorans TaxID=153622 RepID=UPI0022328D13|nr:hypothetical protein [Vibrio agarivorans]
MSTKNFKQILNDMSDDEFKDFATNAFLELVDDAKVEALSIDDVVIKPVSADFNSK